jgi:hypothetical protein
VSRRVEGSVDTYGQPAVGLTTIFSGLSVYLWSVLGSKKRIEPGEEQIGDFRMMVMPGANLMVKDIIEPVTSMVGFTRADILWVKPIMDFGGGMHHIEANLRSF